MVLMYRGQTKVNDNYLKSLLEKTFGLQFNKDYSNENLRKALGRYNSLEKLDKLGLTPATSDKANKNYRHLSSIFHPDYYKNENVKSILTEISQAINEAYKNIISLKNDNKDTNSNVTRKYNPHFYDRTMDTSFGYNNNEDTENKSDNKENTDSSWDDLNSLFNNNDRLKKFINNFINMNTNDFIDNCYIEFFLQSKTIASIIKKFNSKYELLNHGECLSGDEIIYIVTEIVRFVLDNINKKDVISMLNNNDKLQNKINKGEFQFINVSTAIYIDYINKHPECLEGLDVNLIHNEFCKQNKTRPH